MGEERGGDGEGRKEKEARLLFSFSLLNEPCFISMHVSISIHRVCEHQRPWNIRVIRIQELCMLDNSHTCGFYIGSISGSIANACISVAVAF